MKTENKDIVPWMQAIGAAKHKFGQIAAHTAIDYDKESMFAMQSIRLFSAERWRDMP